MAEGKGRPVDGLEMWKKRLALYDPEPPSFAASIEKGICTNTGVPKAMVGRGEGRRELGGKGERGGGLLLCLLFVVARCCCSC